MERKLAGVLGPNRLASAATWNDLTKVITAKDLVDQLVRIPCSSTEQTLLAAILTRCGFAFAADEMLQGQGLSRIARLDPQQKGILHAILM